ncbi:PREDICTED: uncharacterized protein LOC104824577 [Tarenaya hassleriana]|uniref:uncharacterized protein LOC104824577 n=1 Tax=Tarenaya hassleriana TaxID=28532 RepID=UPI00053C8970|nr:PREDICTED: uncharacterized protein LOC104824577 [Tarenaya hassleriana]
MELSIDLGYVRMYKWKAPLSQATDVLLIVVVLIGTFTTWRFSLSRSNRLSVFIREVFPLFPAPWRQLDQVADKIVEYIDCNFSFRDLRAVAPAPPGLVIVIGVTMNGATWDISSELILRSTKRLYCAAMTDDEGHELVPILPPTAEITVRNGDECCLICKQEEEINAVVRTICNHVFHITCIARSLAQRNSCPVCSTDFPTPIDARILFV